jgi:hypothetical protein
MSSNSALASLALSYARKLDIAIRSNDEDDTKLLLKEPLLNPNVTVTAIFIASSWAELSLLGWCAVCSLVGLVSELLSSASSEGGVVVGTFLYVSLQRNATSWLCF